jgi:hypothetical protein
MSVAAKTVAETRLIAVFLTKTLRMELLLSSAVTQMRLRYRNKFALGGDKGSIWDATVTHKEGIKIFNESA